MEQTEKENKMREYSRRKCKRCGEEFTPTGPCSFYCISCKKEVKMESDAKNRIKKRKAQVSSGDNKKSVEPPSKVPDIVTTEGKVHEPGLNNLFLGQLLFVSSLIDDQINSAIEKNEVDTKVLLDIRFRVGEVLRGSLPCGTE
jgi:hypothetical protein